MSRPKGFKHTEKTKQKSRESNTGKHHNMSEEGLLQMHLANIRRRGKTTKKKPRIEVICPICNEIIITYITIYGVPNRKYHGKCWRIQRGILNSLNPIKHSLETRQTIRKIVIENYQKDPEIVEKIRQSVSNLYQDSTYRENNQIKQVISHQTPEYRQRAREAQLKLLREHPERSGNSGLKRNRMTSIEKLMQEMLEQLNIPVVWNSPVRTNKGTKFPDFTLSPALVIQCDGEYWHRSPDEDNTWDEALLDLGYSVLRFTQTEIEKFPENVKEIISSVYQNCLLGQKIYHSYRNSPILVK